MARWALIVNNKVRNTVDSTGQPTPGTWVDITGQHVGVGYSYNGVTFTAPDPVRWISWEAFLDRFTSGEEVDMEVASCDNPAGTNAERKASAKIRLFYRRYETAGRLRLDKAKVRSFVQQLETDGVIGTGRALQILDATVTAGEAP